MPPKEHLHELTCNLRPIIVTRSVNAGSVKIIMGPYYANLGRIQESWLRECQEKKHVPQFLMYGSNKGLLKYIRKSKCTPTGDETLSELQVWAKQLFDKQIGLLLIEMKNTTTMDITDQQCKPVCPGDGTRGSFQMLMDLLRHNVKHQLVLQIQVCYCYYHVT